MEVGAFLEERLVAPSHGGFARHQEPSRREVEDLYVFGVAVQEALEIPCVVGAKLGLCQPRRARRRELLWRQDPPAFDDEVELLEVFDALEGVFFQDQQVGVVSGLKRADLGIFGKDLGGRGVFQSPIKERYFWGISTSFGGP